MSITDKIVQGVAYRIVRGKLVRLRNKQHHPKAHIPNKPSPHVKHTPPTKKPGEGLTGKRKRLHRLMVLTVGNPYH